VSDNQEHCFFFKKTEIAHYFVLHNMIGVLVYDQSILAIPSGHFLKTNNCDRIKTDCKQNSFEKYFIH